MAKSKPKKILWILVTFLSFILFAITSNFLAPLAAKHNTLNPYYLLSWGAPAVFYEDVDEIGASFKLEPWRLLGLQLPAFASISPEDWQEVTWPSPGKPTNPAATLPLQGGVAIYHSHASEAFVPSSREARSENFSLTVVKLGQVISHVLEDSNIPVIHDSKYHDQVYNKSNVESRKTALAILESAPDTCLLIDVHRDGVGKTAEAGREVTTATVNSRPAGKIMFVISSAHENWQKNNRIANDLHNLLEDKYPGLSRGILIRLNSTYNQDLHPGAILVEIGGHWNSLEEAIYGAELFADILAVYFGGAQ
ncbi:MAG TPA: hypothetical protein DEA85_08905 [Firmicutes bacterium]|nr:hypothetical protein [Bacillota bacterium]